MESLDTDLTAPGALRRHLHGGHQAVHVVAPAHTSHVITEFFIKVQSLLVAKETLEVSENCIVNKSVTK